MSLNYEEKKNIKPVHIYETLTWVDVLKKNLSVNIPETKKDEPVIQLKNISNISHKIEYNDYCLFYLDNKCVKDSRKKNVLVREDDSGKKIICNCEQCVYDRNLLIEQNTCDNCGIHKPKNTIQYNSVFSKEGIMMCAECANRECCPSCRWESGGGLCRYCRNC
jgi:hypothetical protein